MNECPPDRYLLPTCRKIFHIFIIPYGGGKRILRPIDPSSLEYSLQLQYISSSERWRLLNEQTDEQLVKTLMDGEHDALTVLFDRYHRLVYSIAFRIVRDPGEAEEVVQTVFVDFFRAQAKFDPNKGILKVWLLQYAYHRAVNRKRYLSANRFHKWVDPESAAAEPALSWSPNDVAELTRLMEQLLSTLSPHRREILELTYFEGLTAEEVAIRIRRSVNVVRHELYRGLASLRDAITSDRKLALKCAHTKGEESLNANAQAI
jgi:RNA polymerase sigma-70 factor, ECF subfamily